MDKHCTSAWYPGLKNCKMRDFSNCPRPDWPTSCPVVSEGLRRGCRTFQCPTETPEEFYGTSGLGSSESPTDEMTTQGVTTEPVDGYSWVQPTLAVCGILSVTFWVSIFIWKCCLSAGSRQRVRAWVVTLRDGAIALTLALGRMVLALWRNTVGRLNVPQLYRGQGQFAAPPPPQVVVQGPAQGQGVGQQGVGGPPQQQGAPQVQGGARRRAPPVPQGVGVLAQVGVHLQQGGGPNPVPVNAGPVAVIPNPPINVPGNLLLQQPNLPYLPPNAQQVQHLQNQGLVPAMNQPPPLPLVGPAQGPLVAAPAPAQAPAPQAGSSFSDPSSLAELGLAPVVIDDSHSPLNDFHEQFTFFTSEAFNANFYSFPGAHDLSDSESEIEI